MTDKRGRARVLAEAAWRDGEPLRWFEELYREGERGESAVPWFDAFANPIMVRALGDTDLRGRSVLVIGCGYGDDAAWLAERGATVTAFDLAPTAVRRAAERFAGLPIRWEVADLLALPAELGRGGFELVVEISTLQCLPPDLRGAGLAAVAGAVGPGGELVAIARGRDPDEPPGTMPWPLTPAELRAVEPLGLEVTALDDFLDDEDPPVRRLVLRARRRA